MNDPDVAAYHLWAATEEPGSVDGAVGFVLAAQSMHDMRVLRRLIQQALTKDG